MPKQSIIKTKDCRIVSLKTLQNGTIELEMLEAPPITVTDEMPAKGK